MPLSVRLSLIGILAALALPSRLVFAAYDDEPGIRAELSELRQALLEQKELLAKQAKIIERQGKEIEHLEKMIRLSDKDQEGDSPRADTPADRVLEQTSTALPEMDDSSPNTSRQSGGLEFGYDNGFVISSPEGLSIGNATVPFQLKINSWFQLRHTVFDSDGPNPDENDLEFERLRLLFSGHVFTSDLEYFIQLDGDDDQSQQIDALDYYLSYDVGHQAFCLDPGHLGIRAGRWKTPYNRTRHTSALRLQFTDRSIASSFFDADRSVGVGLYGETECDARPVSWEVALINGIRTNQFRPVRSTDLDRNFGAAARIFGDLVGEWGPDEESDLSWHELPAVRAGAGFAYSRENLNDGTLEFLSQRVVDSGATLASVLPPGVDKYTVLLYSADLNFKYHGLSILTEYYFRQLVDFAGGSVADLFDHGFLLQSGYFVIPKRLEVYARWSRIVGDSGTLGRRQQSADEVAGGMCWFIKGQSLKLLFDITHLNGAPIRDLALNILPGDDGWLFRSQFQFSF